MTKAHSACKLQIQQRLKLAVASLQDYETAQSTLKLLASDYKSDKAYKHLAGVQVSSLPPPHSHRFSRHMLGGYCMV